MNKPPLATHELIAEVVAIAIAAGEEILAVYAGDFAVETKADGTPLTQADRRANELITQRLMEISALPILSEESAAQEFKHRRRWSRFWLVDPLDGTKEFVRRSDQFSVNIALIENAKPTLGVVYAPVSRAIFYAAAGGGAYQQCAANAAQQIRGRKFNHREIIMATSRSHPGPRIAAYQTRLEKLAKVELIRMGSSLKICAVAAGDADIYPRLGPTSEWDTAAAHCILAAAGGAITDLAGAPLRYNKTDLLNPWFVAYADAAVAWAKMAGEICA